MRGFSIDGPEWAVTILTHDRGPQTNNIHPREKGNMVNNLKRHPKPSLPDELRPDVAPETIESNKEE